MKYCTKCGAELPDDAQFCSSCGAAQNAEAKEVKEVKKEEAPIKQLSDSERYEQLVKNDPKFVDTVRVGRKAKLVGLLNLLFIIPWLVNIFSSVGIFTGINATMSAPLGKDYPFGFTSLDLFHYIQVYGYMGPSGGLQTSVFPIMIFILGFILIPLFVLGAVLGNPKGYSLKTYEQDNGKTLYLSIKKSTNWFLGPAVSLMTLAAPLGTYLACIDLDYKDKRYPFGEVKGNLSGFITCIVVTLIFVAIMISVSLVLRNLIIKKLDKYYK